MISCLISFLISALVLALVLYVVQWVLGIAGFSVPAPIFNIVIAICILVLLLSFLPCLSSGGGLGLPWHWGPGR